MSVAMASINYEQLFQNNHLKGSFPDNICKVYTLIIQ